MALVERTSLARGALPVLPQGLAWICLILNGFLPGTGGMVLIYFICLTLEFNHLYIGPFDRDDSQRAAGHLSGGSEILRPGDD